MDSFKDVLERYKLPLGLTLVGLVLIVGGLIVTPKKTPNFPKESIVTPVQKYIKADISGEVNTPGVYELEEGSRIEDLIRKAGGVTSLADFVFISKNINLAQKVIDGNKLYIPKAGEAVPAHLNISQGQSVSGAQASNININSASQTDLESLPGIGPVTATNIIQNRPFATIEELLTKKVVNKSTFEKIKATIVAN